MSLRSPLLAALPARQSSLSSSSLSSQYFLPRIRLQQQKRQKQQEQQHRRSFLSPSILSPPLQRITASRTLPYPSLPIYLTIANVPQYSTFLPYCLTSKVTHWSHKDTKLGRRWPERAELEVGWGAVRERFASRIYCVPGRVVEAVAGDGVASVSGSEISHHSHEQVEGEGMSGDILTHLSTRWEVKPVGADGQSTRVTLDIEVKFANPVYAAMSQVAAEKVAEKMIEAFELRIQEEMKNQPHDGAAGGARESQTG